MQLPACERLGDIRETGGPGLPAAATRELIDVLAANAPPEPYAQVRILVGAPPITCPNHR